MKNKVLRVEDIKEFDENGNIKKHFIKRWTADGEYTCVNMLEQDSQVDKANHSDYNIQSDSQVEYVTENNFKQQVEYINVNLKVLQDAVVELGTRLEEVADGCRCNCNNNKKYFTYSNMSSTLNTRPDFFFNNTYDPTKPYGRYKN